MEPGTTNKFTPDQWEKIIMPEVSRAMRTSSRIRKIVAAARSLTLCDEEDLYQDAVELIVKQERHFDPTKGNLENWVWMQTATAIQDSYDFHTRRKDINLDYAVHVDRSKYYEGNDLASKGYVTGRDGKDTRRAPRVVDSEVVFVVEDIANTLSDFQRSVLDLRVQGYTGEEMAELLGVSRITVNRALRKIKKQVEELYPSAETEGD